MKKLCINTKTYSGYLDQNEFVTRYLFIKNRINNSFTREELAFLLGKTPYFVIDYEELSGSIKLGIPELDILCRLLKRGTNETLILDKTFGKIDISHEKRMVRVIQKEYPMKFVYNFIHPWTSGGVSPPLLCEEPKYDISGVENDSKEIINEALLALKKQGFFETMRTASEIYERIWSVNKYRSNAWSAVFLKDLLYLSVRKNELFAKQLNGQFIFQIRNRMTERKCN